MGKAAGIAIAIAAAMKAIQLIVETWFMRIQKAKEKVSELSEEYNNVKDELDSINSKLEENKKKIKEINENGLDFTGEQLAELQKQNEELELQKQYLEDIEEIKKKQLNNATQELLDLNSYSSLNKKTDIDSAVWEQLRNGQYEKALGTYGPFKYNEKDNDLLRILKDVGNVTLTPFNGPLGFLWNTVNRFRKADENITAQESAQEQINKLNDLLDTKKSLLSNSEGLDYTAYIEINDQIDEMNKSLTETMSYLTEQQKTLDENSKLYKQINDLVGQFSKTNENIKLNESGFIDLTLDTYFDEDNFNEDTFKKVQKKLQKKNIQFLMDGTINDRTTNYFKDILSQNGITIESNATLNGSTSVKAESYAGIINALEEINTLKEQGAWYDNAANNAVVEKLSSLIKLTDEERDYVELVSKLNTYNFINGFLSNNDLGISDLSEISANTYTAFKNALVEKAQSEGQDTALIESVLANLFPDYQTVEGRMKEYVSQNPSSAIARAIDEYNKTGVASVTVTGALSEEFEALGASAENANSYVRDLAQSITEEKIAALDSATAQAKQDFITNKSEYDDKFTKVQTAYNNALNAITEGSSISYDDMWTLINADATLSEKFTKSATGYKIAINDLTDSQNNYVQNTKHEYFKAIEDAEKTIEDLQFQKDQFTKKLNNTTDAVDRKLYLDEIDRINEDIEENTQLIAQNRLMYEQVGDSFYKYTEQIEKAVNRLSTFKSILSSIISDISLIGHIGADSLIQLIEAFPDTWQNLIKPSETGKGFDVDKEAYKDQVAVSLGFSGANQETISADLTSDIGDDLSDLAKKYGIVYDKGATLAEQFKEIKTKAAVNGTTGFKEFSDKLNELETEFNNVDESALAFVDIINTALASLDEDEALANFNAKIKDLKRQLDLDQITQEQYNQGYAEASQEYKNNVGEVDDPATQEQLDEQEVTIYQAKVDQLISDFNKKVEKLQHKLSQGEIDQDYFDKQYEIISNTFKQDVQTSGVSNNEQIKSTIQQINDTVHSADQNALKKKLDKETQELEDAYDHNLISAEEYYRKLSALEDEYYGKDHDYISPDDLKKLRDFETNMQKEYGLGNVDLTKRPFVSAETMRKAGYEAEDGETATVYSHFNFLWQGNEENGKYVAVHYTPILPDGTVLDEKSLDEYINSLVGSDDILKADTKGIILKVDSDVEISEDDIKSLDTDKPTENIQKLIQAGEDWAVSLHNIQGEWVDLARATKSGAELVKEGLLDDPDGTNVSEKNRNLLNVRSNLANDDNALLKEKYQKNEITFAELEKELDKNLKYWLGDVEEFKKAYDDLDRENRAFLYQEEIDLEDKSLERGDETNYEYAQHMLNIWKKYYKGKDKYRKEDLEAERQAVNAAKQAAQSQIDGLQHLIDLNNDNAEGQITELQRQKDQIEHKYDKQVKALQKQKDLISDAVDKEDRRLKILEAQKELQKSTQSTRQVYGADGTISYKADTEKTKEAQKNWNDAVTTEILNLIQDDIDALEKEKENKTDPIDDKIWEIEQARDEANSYLQAIVKMLTALVQDSYDIDSDYIKRLLDSPDAKAELDKINKEREQAGEAPFSWDDISNILDASKTVIDGETTQKDKEEHLINSVSETSEPSPDEKVGTPQAPAEPPKSEDNKTDVSQTSTESANNGVVDIDYWMDRLQRLLETPIPVTISDNVRKNINEANQKVQSDVSQINSSSSNNSSLTFTGDIIINNPVGNSDDLAKELMADLPNAFQKQMYSNLAK